MVFKQGLKHRHLLLVLGLAVGLSGCDASKPTTVPSQMVELAASPAPASIEHATADGPHDAPTFRIPHRLTRFDIATPNSLLYQRQVQAAITGEQVANWTGIPELIDVVGSWIKPYLEAPQIATLIHEAFPVGGEPAMEPVRELVADCARVLHIEPPQIFIRNSAQTVAYVVEIDSGKRACLVLTSGLLNLYENRPAELRFIVGRELGHFACGHAGDRRKAFGLFLALQQISLRIVPDDAQQVLPALAFGRMMSYFREIEFSADRAGLLCCQNPQVAYDALLRQLSGLRADSTWIDPSDEGFDVERYLKEIEYWENRPFVQFLQAIQKYSASSPFVPDRVARLKHWADSGEYQRILERTADTSPDPHQIVTVRTIQVFDVAENNADVNPYVVAHLADAKWFTSGSVTGRKSARWTKLDQTRGLQDGEPIFVEVWSDGWFDTLLGGCVVYPRRSDANESGVSVLQVPIDWNWTQRTGTVRQGYATVEVQFSTRAQDPS
jgi:Zn-dependent protease with chaperone function